MEFRKPDIRIGNSDSSGDNHIMSGEVNSVSVPILEASSVVFSIVM